MSIISFCSNGRGETGKTSAIVAISTFLATTHRNYKILILDTKYKDYFYQDCYWKEDKIVNKINLDSGKINIASGISGLSKAILSNKTSPEIIPNYTKIVFRDMLEILTETDVSKEEYNKYKPVFKDIAKIASKYYDLVFIDIDSRLEPRIVNSLLEISDLIVPCISQKMRQIDRYKMQREQNILFSEKAILPLVGRYDKNSKYNQKNVTRYLKEKKQVLVVPYNTLFFEACSEGTVVDFFMKFIKINPKDKNALFISEIRKASETILNTLQELQMRM